MNGLNTFKPGRRKSLSFPVAIVHQPPQPILKIPALAALYPSLLAARVSIVEALHFE